MTRKKAKKEHTERDAAIGQAVASFRVWLAESYGLEPSTCRSYGRILGTVLRSGKPPYDYLKGDFAPDYRRVLAATLRRWAECVGDTELDEALRDRKTRRLVSTPKSTPGRSTTALSEDGLDAFLGVLDGRDEPAWARPVIGFMARLGLRAHDALRLSKADLRAADGSDRIRVIGKGEKARILPTAPVEEEIRLFLAIPGRWKNAWDIVAPTSRTDESRQEYAYQKVWGEVRSIAGEAGIEGMSTHRLRKAAARRLYVASGNDINAVRKLLGHADPKTTIRYLEIDEDDWIASAGEMLKR